MKNRSLSFRRPPIVKIMTIPFNKPYLPAGTLAAVLRSAISGRISGNGNYTKKCQRFFEQHYGFRKCLLTTSCTDALEMAALLSDIHPGDEVILPSFTFVSTANAFLLRGARLIFADTLPDLPNIDPKEIEKRITPRTKAVVVVHYSGIACDMDPILELARECGLVVIEDAAHGVDGRYKGKPLGSLGHFGTFSFHETKNIISGEGGMLAVNEAASVARAEIVWEKGTNRAAFFRGEVDKYNWVDVGSSFLPSDMTAAVLYAQLRKLKKIQARRVALWNRYAEELLPLQEKGFLKMPVIPDYATVNGNLFYFTVNDANTRDHLLAFLKKQGIAAVFHYLPLHDSPYFRGHHDAHPLPNTIRFSETIVRLPFFYGLTEIQIRYISKQLTGYFSG